MKQQRGRKIHPSTKEPVTFQDGDFSAWDSTGRLLERMANEMRDAAMTLPPDARRIRLS